MKGLVLGLLVVAAGAQEPLETPARVFSGHGRGIVALAVSRDGSLALTGSEDKTVKLWDASTGALRRTFAGHTDYVFGVAISSDSRLALSGSQDSTARLWEVSTGKELRKFSEPGQVFAVAFSPDSRRILTGGRGKTVTIWDRASGAPLLRLEGHTGTVLAGAFSPDGTRVLTSGQDKTVRLWDARTGAPLRTLTGHAHWVLSLAFASDGRRAISGGFDKTVILWDLETGKALRTFTGHTNAILGVALSPDGRRILSGGEDRTARLWNADTGETLRVIHGHQGDLCCVAFALGGSAALTASDDGLMKEWPLTLSSERVGDLAHPRPLVRPVAREDAAQTAKSELGKRLFFDKRLSDGTVSCATCHDPAKGWTDQRPVSRGVHGQNGRRNAPSIVDAGTYPVLLWDGRAHLLEEQAMIPIGESIEMGPSTAAAVGAISKVPGYAPLFAKAFGDDEVTLERIVAAIAAFERSLTSAPSAYDRWQGGDASALTPQQARGKDLFFGKASCFACHSGPHLSDFQFHNIGVTGPDHGRGVLSGDKRDDGAFRTPTVRNLARTFPYMHDGSLKTLEEVVEFYDRGGNAPKRFDFEIQPLGLTADEKKDLVAFLRALDGELPRVSPPVLP